MSGRDARRIAAAAMLWSDRRPILAAAVVLFPLWFAVFARHFALGFTFPWDFAGKYSTTPAFVASTIGAGRFTEWVPFAGAGAPLAADPQSGLYYPLWWLLGALGVPVTVGTVTAVQALHVVLGAFGVLALGRARDVAGGPALVAATAYLFFGGFYGNAQHADVFRGHALAPWVLWSATPPPVGERWRRVLWMPLWTWLLVSSAYPGQVVAFACIAAAYLAVDLGRSRALFAAARKAPLAALALACAAIGAALLLPYLSAEHAGLLQRPAPASAAWRAIFSFHAPDLLAGYLTPFAWHTEGSIAAWAIGVPALIGVAALGRAGARRHAALVGTAVVATLLASLPASTTIGEWMTRAPYLFPSRFPAADAKAMLAVALVVLSAAGWQRATSGAAAAGRAAPLALGLALLVGASLAPQQTPIAPTRWPVALGGIVAASVALAVGAGIPASARLLLLLPLVVLDGLRVVDDSRHAQGIRTWAVPSHMLAAREARDEAARALPALLARPPASRPARIPPLEPVDRAIAGSPADSLGYLGLGYFLSDHGNFITRARWAVQHDERLLSLALEPWRSWQWSCAAIDCTAESIALPATPWPDGASVRTLRYGTSEIAYRVDADEPILLVENEISFPGWQSDRADVRAVDVGGVFRGWVLPAGRYDFVARYRLPQRTAQLCLAALAIAAWIAAAVSSRRRRDAPGAAERS